MSAAETFTRHELALVLAGLRALQELCEVCEGDWPDGIADILADADMDCIEMGEVDELCERLNAGPRAVEAQP